MKTLFISLLSILLLLGASAQAEMYRWVDKAGKVHYGDRLPPPSETKKVEEKKFGGNLIQAGNMPYATQQAAKNFPVTLYTGDCGEFCTKAKAYLAKRGIPYSERLPGKNPADTELFKKISTENLIPVLQVGSTNLKGYEESTWAAALDQAGYPKTNPFPAGQQPKPTEPSKAEIPAPAANTPATPKPEESGRKSY